MAKFEKGQSGNPNGKPKGVLSKDTQKFKEALNNLLEQSADQMISWLGEIDNPKQRFDVLKDLAEYIHPKLARQELQPLDQNGDKADLPKNVTNIILSKLSTEEIEQALEQSNQDNV